MLYEIAIATNITWILKTIHTKFENPKRFHHKPFSEWDDLYKILIAMYKHTKTVLMQLIAEINLKISTFSASHPIDFDRVFVNAKKSQEKTE